MAKTRIDIEDLLVWAYRDQAVDEAPNRIIGPGVALMRWDVAVDAADYVGDPHPDAFTLHAKVRMLSRVQSSLVIACAKTAVRPDWYPGSRPVMAAIVNGRGDPAGIYDRTNHVIGHRVRPALELATGEVVYGHGGDVQALVRQQYRVWHAALMDLSGCLSGILEDHVAVMPLAPSEPWRHELTAPPSKPLDLGFCEMVVTRP